MLSSQFCQLPILIREEEKRTSLADPGHPMGTGRNRLSPGDFSVSCLHLPTAHPWLQAGKGHHRRVVWPQQVSDLLFLQLLSASDSRLVGHSYPSDLPALLWGYNEVTGCAPKKSIARCKVWVCSRMSGSHMHFCFLFHPKQWKLPQRTFDDGSWGTLHSSDSVCVWEKDRKRQAEIVGAGERERRAGGYMNIVWGFLRMEQVPFYLRYQESSFLKQSLHWNSHIFRAALTCS